MNIIHEYCNFIREDRQERKTQEWILKSHKYGLRIKGEEL